MAASVSVIIPTYNRCALLQQALDSVFAQTFPDFEVIVVDDGSDDGTAAALQPLVQRGRLRVVGKANGGPSSARNRGIDEAAGEYIALLDDDDLWPPEKLAWQVAALSSNPAAVLVYGFMESFGQERRFRWPPPDGPTGWVRQAFLRKNWIRSPGQALIRHSALRAVGGFDATVWSADDWDLYLRLAEVGPFVYEHRHALSYRVHADNLSKRAWLLFVQAWHVHTRHAGAVPRRGEAGTWLKCRASMLNTLQRDLRARIRAGLIRQRG
jgi:glycosyltransferase involved in cell wall biosynthesis